jgi:hypothetical protein
VLLASLDSVVQGLLAVFAVLLYGIGFALGLGAGAHYSTPVNTLCFCLIFLLSLIISGVGCSF